MTLKWLSGYFLGDGWGCPAWGRSLRKPLPAPFMLWRMPLPHLMLLNETLSCTKSPCMECHVLRPGWPCAMPRLAIWKAHWSCAQGAPESWRIKYGVSKVKVQKRRGPVSLERRASRAVGRPLVSFDRSPLTELPGLGDKGGVEGERFLV